MYVLVLWIEEFSTSVVTEKAIKIDENGRVTAKYENKFYPVKIIRKSNSKRYLESLYVAKDGTACGLSKFKSLTSKCSDKQGSSSKIRRKTDSTNLGSPLVSIKCPQSKSNAVTNSSGVFGAPKQLCNADVTRATNGGFICTAAAVSMDVLDINETVPSLKEVAGTARDKNSGQEGTSNCNRKNQFNYSLQSSDGDEIVQDDALKQNSDVYKSKGLSPKDVLIYSLIPGSQKTELIPGSEIYVKTVDLTRYTLLYETKSNKLACQLMRQIIGENNLRAMSPKGRGGYRKVPTVVYDAVQQYVSENAEPQLSSEQFQKIIMSLSCTIRKT